MVCTGGLTRIASRITAFDKEYEAIIAFGSETDTLDPYGEVVRSAPLPTVEAFVEAFEVFRGELMQRPPAFSALHIDGKRSSDLARKGVAVEVPERKISVFSSSLKEIKEKDGLVEYAHVIFHVSKGTYIRSLARDIAVSCGSASHLAGLLRTKVGSFRLEDAAGCSLLKPFSIERVVSALKSAVEGEITKSETDEESVQAEIRQKIRSMTPSLALECGFTPLYLRKEYVEHFFHGKALSEKLFQPCDSLGKEYAVFFHDQVEEPVFAGMIEKSGKFYKYGFVMSGLF